MIARFLMIAFVSFAISGCATTPQAPSPVNQLQNHVADLQQRMEQQEKEVVDLKYEVKEIAGKIESGKTVDMEESDEGSGSFKTGSSAVNTQASPIIKATGVTAVDLQKALKGAGLYDGKIDGKIGSKTRAAVIEFQKQHNLKSDGVVGQKTWGAMKSYIPVE
ncbi:MAG: peptidoglycan-binding protein [Candidatus Omnitrophica bacterium]|nr:peptidoglycan-binding protein [Candidatus Omnitrophota bacterium]